MRFWDKWKNHFKAGLLLSMLVLVVCATVVYAAGGGARSTYQSLVVEHVWIDGNNAHGTRPNSIQTTITNDNREKMGQFTLGPTESAGKYEQGKYEDLDPSHHPKDYTLNVHYITVENNIEKELKNATYKISSAEDPKQVWNFSFSVLNQIPGYKFVDDTDNTKVADVLMDLGHLLKYKVNAPDSYSNIQGRLNLTEDEQNQQEHEIWVLYEPITEEEKTRKQSIRGEIFCEGFKWDEESSLPNDGEKRFSLGEYQYTDFVPYDVFEQKIKELKEKYPLIDSDNVIVRITDSNNLSNLYYENIYPDGVPACGQSYNITFKKVGVDYSKSHFSSFEVTENSWIGKTSFGYGEDRFFVTPANEIQELLNRNIENTDYKYETKIDPSNGWFGAHYNSSYYDYEYSGLSADRSYAKVTYTHTLKPNDPNAELTYYTVLYEDGQNGKAFSTDEGKGDINYTIHKGLLEGSDTPSFARYGGATKPGNWEENGKTYVFDKWVLKNTKGTAEEKGLQEKISPDDAQEYTTNYNQMSMAMSMKSLLHTKIVSSTRPFG